MYFNQGYSFETSLYSLVLGSVQRDSAVDLYMYELDSPGTHDPPDLLVSHLSHGQVVPGTETDHEAFAARDVECKQSILWIRGW